MKLPLLIAVAGALGTLSRYGVDLLLQRLETSRFPYATFAVNVVGSFLIGFCITIFMTHANWAQRYGNIVTVGYLGGFTTYSAFAYQTLLLIHNRQLMTAATYVTATIVLAGIACAGGIALGRAFQ